MSLMQEKREGGWEARTGTATEPRKGRGKEREGGQRRAPAKEGQRKGATETFHQRLE